MNAINYFWEFVFRSLSVAMFSLATIALAIAIIVAIDRWIAIKKHFMRYKRGYENAINDAIADIKKMYEEYENDEMTADIPCERTILNRLEKIKNDNSKHIR